MNSGTMKASRADAELQLGALTVRDLAAGRGDHRVAGRDVPFAGGGEAGIDVDFALRHPAEFDRRAELCADRARPAGDKGLGSGDRHASG